MRVIARNFSNKIVKSDSKVISVSSKKHSSLEQSGFYTNQEASLDLRSNPKLSEIMSNKQISLTDKEISISSLNISDSNSLPSSDIISSDLGKINLYKPNQILLDDIDPYNIPEDKHIILSSNSARVQAVGKLMQGEGTHGQGRVHSQIFVEETKRHGVGWTWKSYLKLLPLLPGVYYILLYIQAVREYYTAKGFYDALDREDKELLDILKHIPRKVPEDMREMRRMFSRIE